MKTFVMLEIAAKLEREFAARSLGDVDRAAADAAKVHVNANAATYPAESRDILS